MRCLTGVDHMSRQTCLGQERDFGGYELCGTRALVGRLSLCYTEGLMLDPMCDTPHVRVTIAALQRSSKVTESVWCHTHAFSSKRCSSQHTGVCESSTLYNPQFEGHRERL